MDNDTLEYLKGLLSKVSDNSDDPQADKASEGFKQIGKALYNSKPVQNVITGEGLQNSYNNAVAASKGDPDAQMNVANNSLSTAMGSLGPKSDLPMDEASRLARAKDMGFDPSKTYYHGTKANIEQFEDRKPINGQAFGKGIYLAERPQDASGYATGDGGNVIPVNVRLENPFNTDEPISDNLKQVLASNPKYKNLLKKANEENADNFTLYGHMINKLSPSEFTEVLKKAGYDGVTSPANKTAVVFDPKKIRSKYANFDPNEANSSKLSYAFGGEVGEPTELSTDQDPQSAVAGEGLKQGITSLYNSEPIQNIITGKGLRNLYNNAVSASKGDTQAQMRVANSSLGTAMGSLKPIKFINESNLDNDLLEFVHPKNSNTNAAGTIIGDPSNSSYEEFHDLPFKNSVELNNLSVHPNLQNQVIGHKLYNAFEKEALKNGADSILLNASPEGVGDTSRDPNKLDDLIKFYKSLGFKEFGPKQESNQLMIKPLKGNSSKLSYNKGGIIQNYSDGGTVKPSFDPDKYLAEKGSITSFDPDAYLAEKTTKKKDEEQVKQPMSELESALRGAAQGATFGFAPAISGAINTAPDALQAITGGSSLKDLLDTYRKNRDASKANFKQAEVDNPKSYIGGNIAGALVPAVSTGGIEGASPLLNGAITGAKAGALTGLGQSDADLTKGDLDQALKDSATGAAGGAVLGGVVGKIGGMLPDSLSSKFQNIANERALKSTGMGKSQLKNIILNDINSNVYKDPQELENNVQKMGNLLLKPNIYQDTPVVTAGSSVEDVLNKAQDLKQKSGQDIGDLLKKMDENFDSNNNDFFNPQKVSQQIQTELLDPLKVNGEITPLSGGAANTVQNVLDTLKQYGNTPIPFEQAQQLKQLVNKLTNYETPGSSNNQILRQVGGIINNHIEDAADAVTKNTGSDDLFKRYLAAKDLYKTSATAVNAASQKTAGNMVNRDFGLTDYLAGGIGSHIGGPVTVIASAVGNKIAKTYGNSAMAVGANNTANALSKISYGLSSAPKEAVSNLGKQLSLSPNPIEQRLGGVLSQASQRDDIGRNALIFSLMQNSQYRDILNKHLNNE